MKTLLMPIYIRENVAKDRNNIYVFADNFKRTSGYNNVGQSDNPRTDKLYLGKKFPTQTQAVIRGLPNALPITTKFGFHPNEVWHDGSMLGYNLSSDMIEQMGNKVLNVKSNYDIFKQVITMDIARIHDQYKDLTNKRIPSTIIFPTGGFATGKARLTRAMATFLAAQLTNNFQIQFAVKQFEKEAIPYSDAYGIISDLSYGGSTY